MTHANTTGDGFARLPDCKTFTSAEQRLEAEIKAASDRMCAAPTREGKLEAWREMCRLIDQRTPERVRFMERTRGLA